MKLTYFIHQDINAIERQSDGVEFCKIPSFHDNKIYFYCSEYMLFWSSIEEVGDLNKAKDFQLKEKIMPATLLEICNNELIKYINSIKQYDIENGKILSINYIHIN